jgi:PIN domain nuclease of toxin-antitoxin system
MNLLIDTQSIIWFGLNNPLLSEKARNAIENSNNQCQISMASYWEIAIKKNLGKLDLAGLSLKDFMDCMVQNQFSTFNINQQHILELENLPLYHRDPFDRIIIAQAIRNDLAIVSSDIVFDQYAVTRIW